PPNTNPATEPGPPAPSGQTTSFPQTTAPAGTATSTGSATGTGSATTTTSSASAPPEVPKTNKHRHHGASQAASQGAHVESNLTVGANGDITPPTVSVPSGVGVELHVSNHGNSSATVALDVSGHPSVHVAPGARGTVQTGGLKDGTYRILVNGTPRGQ